MDRQDAPQQDWFTAAHLQVRVLAYLRTEEGLTILSPGHPDTAARGRAIVAERQDGERRVQRLVTVQGWPASAERPDGRLGPAPAARPETLARAWLAQTVLDLALARGSDPDVELGLALPALASYIRYLQRLRWFLAAARVLVYLVAQEGQIRLTPPGTPAMLVLPAGPLIEARRGSRRKLGLPGASRLHLPLLHALVTAGGAASRPELIVAVARWFPEVLQPPPPEFATRLSGAQRALEEAGWTTRDTRGVWRITAAGRVAYAAQWDAWRSGHDPAGTPEPKRRRTPGKPASP